MAHRSDNHCGLIKAALLLAGSLLLAPSAVPAEEWSATLKGGGKVYVDPRTNRTTVRRNGVDSQLWDGVHRLENGRSITVRSGQVVPNSEILRHRYMPDKPELSEGTTAEMWIGAPIIGDSPCEELVGRACGENPACKEKEGCSVAQQLLEMEQQERSAASDRNRMTYSSGQCQEADRDRKFFSSCQ